MFLSRSLEALQLLNDGLFRVMRIRAKQKMCAQYGGDDLPPRNFCHVRGALLEKENERTDLRNHIVTYDEYFDSAHSRFEMAPMNEVCPFEVFAGDRAGRRRVCDYNYIFDHYVGLKVTQQENDYGRPASRPSMRKRTTRRPAAAAITRREVARRACSGRIRNSSRRRQLLLLDGAKEDAGEHAAPILTARWRGDRGGSRRLKQASARPDQRVIHEQRPAWSRLIIHYIGWTDRQPASREDDPVIDFYLRLMKGRQSDEGDGRRVRRI